MSSLDSYKERIPQLRIALDKLAMPFVSSAEALAVTLDEYTADPGMVVAMFRTLFPELFLGSDADALHGVLKEEYPELLDHMKGSPAFFTAFPAAGIPAQSGAIKKHVDPRFNAGIGIGKDDSGDVFLNPRLAEVFDKLRPEEGGDAAWNAVRNKVFGYGAVLGHPWYRAIAKERYLRDAGDASFDVERAMRIDPMPIAGGGTLVNDIAMSFMGGPGAVAGFPPTFWGNMKLKADHHGMVMETCPYQTADGEIDPEGLLRWGEQMKNRGYNKAMLYFNYPQNPTGSYPTDAEARALADAVCHLASPDFKVGVMCDEPYERYSRGSERIRRPFSTYMLPGDNRNMLTFVSINGTKRDGFYGVRHADLIVLTPDDISDAGIQAFEKGKLAGWMRGLTSFPNGLNQYLLARAIIGDPLIALADPSSPDADSWNTAEIDGGLAAYEEVEQEMMYEMESAVEAMVGALRDVPGLTLVQGNPETDCAGGFFLCYKPDEGLSPMAIHKAGLENNCGVIAAGPFVRINASTIRSRNLMTFKENLQATMEAVMK
jgi:aspartate/methionine/tyrosine aminotransferase